MESVSPAPEDSPEASLTFRRSSLVDETAFEEPPVESGSSKASDVKAKEGSKTKSRPVSNFIILYFIKCPTLFTFVFGDFGLFWPV